MDRFCYECSGEGRLGVPGDERTCPTCGGDGLSAEGKAQQERAAKACDVIWNAEHGGTARARRLIAKAEYKLAASELREVAQRLLDAADLIDGQAVEPEGQAELAITCGVHVNPPGHPARDAKCVLRYGHPGPCSAEARAA